MKIGHGLNPCTTNMQHVVLLNPDDPSLRVVLLDTPGIGDTFDDDSEILQRIADWVMCSYDKKMKIKGVIYLRSIALNRAGGTRLTNYTLLNHLCAGEVASSTVLATTHWANVGVEIGLQREQELSRSFWKEKDALKFKTRTVQFQDTHESAWDIINLLIRKDEVTDYRDSARHLLHKTTATSNSNKNGGNESTLDSEPHGISVRCDGFEEASNSRSRNIVIFGETGAGKSSLVNMIVGSEVAATSPHTFACTLDARDYEISIGTQKYRIYDTVGLNEPKKMEQKHSHLDAIEKAYRLFASLSAAGGIHLLIFCFKAGRLTEAVRQTYQLFYDFICDSRVNVALVITHVEKFTPMEDWWAINRSEFDACGIQPVAHACITTLAGAEGDVIQQQKYEASRAKIRALLEDYGSGKPFVKGRIVWTVSVIRRLEDMLELMRILPPRHSTKGMVQYLTQNGLMSEEDAEIIAERIRRVDSDTESTGGNARFRIFGK
ncbi:hypothetical protein BJ138DRAFT_71549 [Hygrophoropsis aurantiaca]|uniref:Uncharacterized protein n=1 Tax=Hygrophoropsis aurantiaca TaxID=72124 RepID=A0ACB8ACB0_9AGAM|nr:hypothetical protein BJ138DRAFT_71549 [Hygrophoropsis aurantiaca]